MIDPLDLNRKVTRLEDLLAQKCAARRGGLSARLRRAGRLVPKHIRRDVQVVAEAEELLGNPKMMSRVDGQAVARAFQRAEAWLRQVDAKDRRKGAILGMLGALVFNLLVLAAGLMVLLVWRGFL